MWICPICSNEEINKYGCTVCGFDRTKDYLTFRTFALVPQVDIDALNQLFTGIHKENYSNGDWYEGEFKDNLRHGKGTQHYISGDKYVGDWKYDYKSGKGSYNFINGDQYTGGFGGDHFYGKGKL